MAQEIIYCPFCGQNKWHIKRAYQVECDVCGAEGPTAKSANAAMLAWNSRSNGVANNSFNLTPGKPVAG